MHARTEFAKVTVRKAHGRRRLYNATLCHLRQTLPDELSEDEERKGRSAFRRRKTAGRRNGGWHSEGADERLNETKAKTNCRLGALFEATLSSLMKHGVKLVSQTAFNGQTAANTRRKLLHTSPSSSMREILYPSPLLRPGTFRPATCARVRIRAWTLNWSHRDDGPDPCHAGRIQA